MTFYGNELLVTPLIEEKKKTKAVMSEDVGGCWGMLGDVWRVRVSRSLTAPLQRISSLITVHVCGFILLL